ncbi:porin [Thiomicrorhabdus sp. ZW0627]|uniref:porin n=1 Tax=Thiomicrorhabdus sp. ZW0627 TaxID=3039774 RepID=UPI002436C652|nr:porin [Thiomicrorhabdus sp. ZW0627]MDG6774779.1 porin [Thiomicrorhabdus sp. ZW0627]
MKKNVIALAIASAIAAPVAMADAPTVYGQINMSIDNVTDAGTSVNSNASRIGIKGSQDLGNGLKAVYKMEWEADVAGGTNATTTTTTFKDRNAYVGLAGGFGTVLMGRHDTPYKMSQATDMFNDGAGDNKPLAGKLGFGGKGGENRAANVLAYVSPSFGGVKIVAAGISPEATDTATQDTSLTDAYSIAAMYGSSKKGLFLSAAYDNFTDNLTGTKDYTETRVSAQYATGGLVANAMYQNFDDGVTGDTATEGSNIQANIGYTMGAFTPKAKYSSVDYKMSTMKDAAGFGVGLDYSFGKKTTGYVEYVSLDKHMANNSLAKSMDTVSVGLLHKF